MKLRKSLPTQNDGGLVIRPISEITHHLSFVIYGRSGVGKTTFAATFPKPILLVDIRDKGTASIAEHKGIDVMQLDDWEDVEKLYFMLKHEPRKYKTKSKNAQEAHEAIRPTSVRRSPAALRSRLSAEQFRLYELIWQRFVASQMTAAIYDTLTVDVAAGKPTEAERPYLFRASGST